MSSGSHPGPIREEAGVGPGGPVKRRNGPSGPMAGDQEHDSGRLTAEAWATYRHP